MAVDANVEPRPVVTLEQPGHEVRRRVGVQVAAQVADAQSIAAGAHEGRRHRRQRGERPAAGDRQLLRRRHRQPQGDEGIEPRVGVGPVEQRAPRGRARFDAAPGAGLLLRLHQVGRGRREQGIGREGRLERLDRGAVIALRPLGQAEVVPGRRGHGSPARGEAQLFACPRRIPQLQQDRAQAGTQRRVVVPPGQRGLEPGARLGRAAGVPQRIDQAQQQIPVVREAGEALARRVDGGADPTHLQRDVRRHLERVGGRCREGDRLARRVARLGPAPLCRECQRQIGPGGRAAGIARSRPAKIRFRRRRIALRQRELAAGQQRRDVLGHRRQRTRERRASRRGVAARRLDAAQRQPEIPRGQRLPQGRRAGTHELLPCHLQPPRGQVLLGQLEQRPRMIRNRRQDLPVDRCRPVGTPCGFVREGLGERLLDGDHAESRRKSGSRGAPGANANVSRRRAAAGRGRARTLRARRRSSRRRAAGPGDRTRTHRRSGPPCRWRASARAASGRRP